MKDIQKILWDNEWNKDKVCYITLSRLRPGKNKDGIPYVIKLTNCKHRFYRKAFLSWIETNNTLLCPVCKKL